MFNLTEKKILKQIISINVLILFLIIVGFIIPILSFIGGAAIVLYITFISFENPKKAFYILIGTKLTYDALWFIEAPIKIPGGSTLLVIGALPLLVVVLMRFSLKDKAGQHFLQISFFYIIWIITAQVINDHTLNISIIVRQSGLFFGLFIGLKFIRTQKEFAFVCLCVFISTIIPNIGAFIQFIASKFGLQILFFTLDTTRGSRFAGFYYDVATAGMISIVSLFTNMYLINYVKLSGMIRKLLIGFYGLCLFNIAIGATRSMIVIATTISFMPWLNNFRLMVKMAPIILIMFFFAEPYLHKAIDRTQMETRRLQTLDYMNLLEESTYRTLLSGRVSLWQDVWYGFKNSSILQQLFGTGRYSNSHSSYFFLLLQIGVGGLFLYLYLHIKLLLAIIKRRRVHSLYLTGVIALTSVLMVGISATTVNYTSFQWIIYTIIGASLNILQENN